MKKVVSVVVPAYKAQNIVIEGIKRLENVLENGKYDYEIICVSDGHEETLQTIRNYAKTRQKIKVFGYEKNMGKGYAVRFGMGKAKGEIIGFIDAGMDIKPEGLDMLLAHFDWYKADIIVGSKRHPVSKVTYTWQRRIVSLFYQLLVRILFGLKVRDTQVGMKFFRREVIEAILPKLSINGFAFDIEMLAMAWQMGYHRIYEAPVDISIQFTGSTLMKKGFVKQVISMMEDTLRVYYKIKIIHSYKS